VTAAFRSSIKRLADLPATAVYPGHFARSNVVAMKAAIAAYLDGRNSAHGVNTYN